VNGSMEMDKSLGSSLTERAILCSDVTYKVGVPKALKWALDIRELEKGIDCLLWVVFLGHPLFLSRMVLGIVAKKVRNFIWCGILFERSWFEQVYFVPWGCKTFFYGGSAIF
jgi:hypothetical protein